MKIKFEKRHQRYVDYKNSGVEWLGEVPDEWEIRKIKTLCQVKRGASPRPIDDSKYFNDNGDYAWVRIADVTANNNQYLEKTKQRLSNLGKSHSVPFEPNTIFLSIAGSVGKPIITKIKCCIHDGFVYFKNLKLSNKFLFNIFYAGEAYKGLGKLGTQLNLNTESVGSIYIPIPNKSEQTAITNYIDEKTALLDSIVEKKQKQIELLKERRLALINRVVTKGLDVRVEMKDSGVEWIGNVPKCWEVRKIGNITKVKSSKRVFEQSYQDKGIPFYRSKEIVELSKGLNVSAQIFIPLTLYKNIELNYSVPKKGDLLLTSIGTIGLTWICDGRDFYFKDGNITQIENNKKLCMEFIN